MLLFINIAYYQEDVIPSLQRLESQIAALPEPELRQFRSWFDEFDAQRWDSTLAEDINNGKLDSLAAEALAGYGAGKCPLCQDSCRLSVRDLC
jgi:hypothetical protein